MERIRNAGRPPQPPLMFPVPQRRSRFDGGDFDEGEYEYSGMDGADFGAQYSHGEQGFGGQNYAREYMRSPRTEPVETTGNVNKYNRMAHLEHSVAMLTSRIQSLLDSDLVHKLQETKNNVDLLSKKISSVESTAKLAQEATKLQQEDKTASATITEFKFKEITRKLDEIEIKLSAQHESRSVQSQLEVVIGHVLNKRLDHIHSELDRESRARSSLEHRLTTVLQENYKKVEEIIGFIETSTKEQIERESKRLEELINQKTAQIKTDQEQQTISILRKVKGKIEQIESKQKTQAPTPIPVQTETQKPQEFKILELRLNMFEEAINKRLASIEETARQQSEKMASAFSKRILEIVHERTADVESRLNARMDKQLSVIQNEAHEIGKLEQKIVEVHERAKMKTQVGLDEPNQKSVEQAVRSMTNKVEDICQSKIREMEDRLTKLSRALISSEFEKRQTPPQPTSFQPRDGNPPDRVGDSIRALQTKLRTEIQRVETSFDTQVREVRKSIMNQLEALTSQKIPEIERQLIGQQNKIRILTEQSSQLQTKITSDVQAQLDTYRKEYESVSIEIRNLTKQLDDKTREEARRLERESAMLKQKLSTAVEFAATVAKEENKTSQTHDFLSARLQRESPKLMTRLRDVTISTTSTSRHTGSSDLSNFYGSSEL